MIHGWNKIICLTPCLLCLLFYGHKVLTDIHKMYIESPLHYPDVGAIEFDIHDMTQTGLNETLYIKMNSRGKHLNALYEIETHTYMPVSVLIKFHQEKLIQDPKTSYSSPGPYSKPIFLQNLKAWPDCFATLYTPIGILRLPGVIL